MKFNFSTSLTDVKVPGAEIEVGKVDISVSMEMSDEAYTGIIELVYEQLNQMFGGSVSIKPSDDESPLP
jgi:hypothetical protein